MVESKVGVRHGGRDGVAEFASRRISVTDSRRGYQKDRDLRIAVFFVFYQK
jgi:hypothetical protein